MEPPEDELQNVLSPESLLSELSSLLNLFFKTEKIIYRFWKTVEKTQKGKTLKDSQKALAKVVHKIFHICHQLHLSHSSLAIDGWQGKCDTRVISVPTMGLCRSYPPSIIIPVVIENENQNQNEIAAEDIERIEQLTIEHWAGCFRTSAHGRTRSRFCSPAMLIPSLNVYIYRSAALAQPPELILRRMKLSKDSLVRGVVEKEDMQKNPKEEKEEDRHSFSVMASARQADARCLERMKVTDICDLMIEDQVLLFHSIPVASSEKLVKRKNFYTHFHLHGMPYPGIEYHEQASANMQKANHSLSVDIRDPTYIEELTQLWETLAFDWEKLANADLNLPENLDLRRFQEQVDLSSYKKWNILTITENYLKYLLFVIATRKLSDQKNPFGLLVHCICGWDRTPTIVCLLRLLLWAEGHTNPGFSPLEILFLAIGYDWFLFGHDLGKRLREGINIFGFCFSFLQFATSPALTLGHWNPALEMSVQEEERKQRLQEVYGIYRQLLNSFN